MIGIDTNILLRWLLDGSIVEEDAPRQTELVSRVMAANAETCFANIVVVAETLWVVANPMRQPKSVQAEIIQRLLDSHDLRVADRKAIVNALEAFRDGPGFIDYLIGELNALAGCTTTLTFDKAAARTPRFTALS